MTFNPHNIDVKINNLRIDYEISPDGQMPREQVELYIVNHNIEKIKWIKIDIATMFMRMERYYGVKTVHGQIVGFKFDNIDGNIIIKRDITFIWNSWKGRSLEQFRREAKEKYIYSYYGETEDGNKFSIILRNDRVFNSDGSYYNSSNI